ncbi:Flp family type IVb pilin [Polymorphum gilvum]|uniref:Flp/Fap pilin component superfamily n=1 Tax=Polymorphum gilvum (strain LMG 25793 / CGMCC 1.9160 / SL003B-26A1) TaxID=991905 RepID=F2J328_POLGS|nr:Flp family type IVb pilin [Polymorphum gilvum]ADZ68898.1 hypothetical protein SL003B_0463 [Polymorphum gilvum SL003B-26A1]
MKARTHRSEQGRTDRRSTLRRFLADERGVTAVEYGLILAMISVAIMATVLSIGEEIAADFTLLSEKLATAK